MSSRVTKHSIRATAHRGERVHSALIGNLNLNGIGFFIVGLFALTRILALWIWRFGHIEENHQSCGAWRRVPQPGSSRQNIAPVTPAAGATQRKSPPWARAKPRAIARPSPAPV